MKLSFKARYFYTTQDDLESWTVRRLTPYPFSHQSTLVASTTGMHHHAQAPNLFFFKENT